MQGLRRRLASSGLPSGLQITEHPRSGRNGLFVVKGNDRSWIAKTSSSGNEAWFYRQIGGRFDWVPPTRVLDDAPEGSGGRQTVRSLTLTEYQDACPTVYEVAEDNPIEALAELVNTAPLIAELHGSEPDGSVPAAQPPLSQLDPVHVSAWIDGTKASIHVLQHLQSRPVLCTALRAAHDGGGPQGLIHGDLKPDNILRGPERPVVIDWELCGTGAVAWDLGSLVGSMLAIWIGGFDLTGDRPSAWFDGAQVPYRDVTRAVSRLLTSYGEHAATVTPTTTEVATATAAWLIGRSWTESLLRREVNALHLLQLIVAEAVVRNPRALLQAESLAAARPRVA